MTGAASELYQRAVLDHNRRPRHYGPLSEFTHQAKGRNPICGDDVAVYMTVNADRIAAVGFTAQSCALCKASASMMCEQIQGQTILSAQDVAGLFQAMIAGHGTVLAGDPGSLAVTKDYPARAKCVLLPWQTFVGALSGREDITTETEDA